MKHFITTLLFLICFCADASSITVYSGEITFRQTGPLEIEASVYLYIRESDVPAQIDSIAVCWGDGNCTDIPVVNGPDTDGDGIPEGQPVGEEYRLLLFSGSYTYSEAGTFTLSTRGPNRPSGILNLNTPNSDQVFFHVYANVQISETGGNNHAPILYEQPLIDEAVIGFPYTHTPNAFDLDGDEIRYEFATPTLDAGIPVPNYITPEGILSGPDNQLSIDPLTGVVEWDSPQRSGRYVVAIKVSTFRDGTLQDEVVRDMVIEVRDEMELPPQLHLSDDTPLREISVGDTLRISATASSLPENDTVIISASGGPFDYFGQGASFDSSSTPPDATGQFEWVAEPEDVREEPYQIVFVAREPTSRLSDLEAIRVKVNALTNAAEATTAPPTLKAYPNPSGGLVQIELPAPNARYQLLDAQGRTVRTGVLNGNPANLNISLLPDGWYVLSCWQNGQYLGQVRLLK
ncbi:MAG: T9SS type A sorting domain-containing protein [Bacteroidetes bacterium]|jgi:hypothetical protein|nr:T9SS type A sorting domain-containing protein [Bacteroidota bacterium]